MFIFSPWAVLWAYAAGLYSSFTLQFKKEKNAPLSYAIINFDLPLITTYCYKRYLLVGGFGGDCISKLKTSGKNTPSSLLFSFYVPVCKKGTCLSWNSAVVSCTVCGETFTQWFYFETVSSDSRVELISSQTLIFIEGPRACLTFAVAKSTTFPYHLAQWWWSHMFLATLAACA